MKLLANYNVKVLGEDKQSVFCVAPFAMSQYEPDGSAGLCCNQTRHGELDWNGPNMKQLRLDIIAGRRNKICKKCQIEEDCSLPSFRSIYNNTSQLLYDMSYQSLKQKYYNDTNEDGSVPYDPSALVFTLGNLCIGQCMMCCPDNSTALHSVHKKISAKLNWAYDYNPNAYKWIDDEEHWVKNIYPKVNSIGSMVVLGGEPFLIKRYIKLLKYCVDNDLAKNIYHYVNTGGFDKPPSEIIELWKYFKGVHVHISIDDIGERNEYIRYPVKWEKTKEVLNWYDNESDTNIQIDIAKTVQNLNLYYVPEMIEWVIEQNYKKVCKGNGGVPYHHLCTNPERCSPKVLPNLAKQIITDKFFNWYDNFIKNYKPETNNSQILDNFEFQMTRVKQLTDFMDDDTIVTNLDTSIEEHFHHMKVWNTALDKQRNTNYLESFPIFKDF
jgi:hypothetical protein